MPVLPLRRWQEMTSADLAGDLSRWIAVLPVAAVEQHGPHLPLATDAIIAEGMVARTIELLPDGLPVSFLPVQAIGRSEEHLGFPGTLTASAETAVRLWTEIGASLARSGIRKLIVVSAHGGNSPVVDLVTQELRLRHRMLAVGSRWMRFGFPDGVFSEEEVRHGIHGGDIETSIMLVLRPDLVRMERAEDFRSAQADFVQKFNHLRAHGPSQFGWLAKDLNPAGVVGNASAASAEKGRAVIDHQAGTFVALCEDVHRFDPDRLTPG